MAAANITIGGLGDRIESDTTGAIITKVSLTLPSNTLTGYLHNLGSATVHILASAGETAAALADIQTDNGQDAGQNSIPAGGYYRVRGHLRSIAHKTAVGTAVLLWQPD